MQAAIDKLRDRIKPTGDILRPPWERIYQRRGIWFPEDYRTFVEVIGVGELARRWAIAPPFGIAEMASHVAWAERIAPASSVAGGKQDEASYLPFACDDTGSYLCWRIGRSNDSIQRQAETWPVVRYDVRGWTPQMLGPSFSESLLAIAEGRACLDESLPPDARWDFVRYKVPGLVEDTNTWPEDGND